MFFPASCTLVVFGSISCLCNFGFRVHRTHFWVPSRHEVHFWHVFCLFTVTGSVSTKYIFGFSSTSGSSFCGRTLATFLFSLPVCHLPHLRQHSTFSIRHLSMCPNRQIPLVWVGSQLQASSLSHRIACLTHGRLYCSGRVPGTTFLPNTCTCSAC